MASKLKELTVIYGPTSSGKTSLALELCKKNNGVIISADSRQIYKHLNIGTGKVPVDSNGELEFYDEKCVLSGVDIYGYDLVLPGEYFSAYDFAKYFKKITDTFPPSQPVFLVGGTGFYINAALGTTEVSDIIPNPELRNELESKELIELVKLLKKLDGTILIDFKNKRRVVRALEKILSKEKRIETYAPPEFEKINFVNADKDRSLLYENVDRWVDKIWELGLIKETQKLIEMGFGETPQLNGIIYKTCKDFLLGNISKDDCIQRIKFDLHGYIRRQQTYFKKFMNQYN